MSSSPAHAEVPQKKPRIKKPEQHSAPSLSLPSGASHNAVTDDSGAEERCVFLSLMLSLVKLKELCRIQY